MSVIDRISEGAREWKDITEDRPLVVSVSGGKDSTAMALWLIDQGLKDRCTFVFADTKWEHPDLYRYLDEVLEPKIGKIHRAVSEKYPGGMADMVKSKGAFPSRMIRFCTEHLKVVPMRNFIDSVRQSTNQEPISVVGIRAQESQRRARFEEGDDGGPMKCDTWRPLITWLVDDVVAIHAKHNIPPCSLYLRDNHPAQRVGCYPCIMSRKSEILAVAEQDPWRIDEIRKLESEVTQVMKDKLAAKGETIESMGRTNPGFFQARSSASGECWPIDKVVEWARTSRGGRQFELFHTSEPGCQMWGLCDIPADKKE